MRTRGVRSFSHPRDLTQRADGAGARRKRVARALLVVGGTLCVGLGITGVFVPVLPTTPFLLLAAICYARSSARFYRWLLTNRWCGEYIQNYRAGRGITLKHKLLTAALLWLTIGYAVGFAVPRWWAKAILLAIAVGVTVHLVKIRTYRREAGTPRLSAPNGSPEESG